MNRERIKTILSYVGLSSLLFTWWWLALAPANSPVISYPSSPILTSPLSLSAPLTSFTRDELHRALNGDYELMGRMIADWEIDAQILKRQGFDDIKHLPADLYHRSQVLTRNILRASESQKNEMNLIFSSGVIYDDIGNPVCISEKSAHFLPQSYIAASFLIALAKPEQIIALPKGVRRQTNIIPLYLSEKIPLDVEQKDSELIALKRPDIAFIANYSHPTTVESLKRQGIQLFTLKASESFQDICNGLMRVGHTINKPLEAELLKLFMEAAMLALDNRYKIHYPQPPKVLFATYYSKFSIPTKRTLTGQLLNRLGILDQMQSLYHGSNRQEWSIDISQEKIVNFKPDHLIISSGFSDILKEKIQTDSIFCGIKENCKHVSFIDDNIQQFPSQYIVLAYFDLVSAIGIKYDN